MIKKFMRMVDSCEDDCENNIKMDQYIDPNSIFDEKCIIEARELGISLTELRNYKQGKGQKPLKIMTFDELHNLINNKKEELKKIEKKDFQTIQLIESEIEKLEYELIKKINETM